jgi:hypothetical protein
LALIAGAFVTVWLTYYDAPDFRVLVESVFPGKHLPT